LRGKAHSLADSDDGRREKRRVSEKGRFTLSAGLAEAAPYSEADL